MVRVPTQDHASVLPSAAPQPYQNIQANPAAFGAGQGQALQQLGQSLGQVASVADTQVKIEAGINNEAAAKDADVVAAQKISERLFSTAAADPANPNGPAAGFFGLKGRAAIDGRDQAIADVQKIREQALAGMANPEARRMLDAALTRRVLSAQEQIGHHANREQTTWWNESSQARIGAAKNDGLNNYTDPNAVGRAELTILGEVNDQAQHNGWSPDVTALKAGQEISDLYKNVVLRMAVQPEGPNSGPVAARKYYADNISRIQGAEHEQLEKFLQPLVDREVARKVVDSVRTGTADSASKLVTLHATESGLDPKLALTTAGIESSFGRDPRATNLGQVKDSTAASVGETNGGDANQQAKVMVKVLEQARSAATAALGRPAENWQAYLTYQQGVAGGPALLKADPNASAVQILSAVYKDPKTAQAAIVGNGGTATMTVGQFLDKWQQTYSKREAAVAVPENLTPAAADPATRALSAEQALAGQLQTIAGMALSPEQKDAAKSRLLADYHQVEAAAAADQKAVRSQLMNVVVGGKVTSIDAVPADLLARADSETQRAVTTLIEHNAKGRDAPPNPQLYYDRVQEFLGDRDTFAGRNLLPDAANLPRADWERLVGLQLAIGKKDAALADKETSLKKVDTVTKSMLLAAGYDLGPKAKQADKDMLVGFQTAMWGEIEAYQTENNRRPSDQDIQQMADRLLIQGRVRGSGPLGADWHWFWDSEKQVSGKGALPNHRFAFSVAAPDRANFYIPHDEIPKDRAAAIAGLLQQRGLPADKKSVEDAYTQWRLQGNR